jgi:hypothetical protein
VHSFVLHKTQKLYCKEHALQLPVFESENVSAGQLDESTQFLLLSKK